MSFINKAVLVTGAGSGFGKAISKNFAKSAARLALVDKNIKTLKGTAEECEKISKTKVFIVEADLTNDDEVRRMIERVVKEYGKIDVLVNCAGIYIKTEFFDDNMISVFDKVMAVNLRSVISVTQAATPAIIASKGCIINVASITAYKTYPKLLSYGVAKAGVIQFTKGAALELAPHGVRVNCISPGMMKTNLLLNNDPGMTEKNDNLFWEISAQSSPMKRLVKVEEAAELVLFLASDKAFGITGSNFTIDAGQVLV